MSHALTVGVGKQLSAHAPEGLGGAPVSGGGRRGECSGVGRWTVALAWGGAWASASKKRSAGLGTAARGAVDGCSGVGRCTGVGVEEEEHGARNGWRGVEIWIISTCGGLLYQTSSLSVLIINQQ